LRIVTLKAKKRLCFATFDKRIEGLLSFWGIGLGHSPFFIWGGVMIQTKKALQEQIEQLQEKVKEQKEVCAQYRLTCVYLAFDRDVTRRERDGVKAQVVLLREELADLKQALEDGGLIG